MKRIFTLLSALCFSTLATAQVPGGAIGYWPFDNNALDFSGNGNNGTPTAVTPTKDRFGNPNMAYKFNGSSSKVVVPNSPSVDIGLNDDFTISVWEKTYDPNAGAVLVGKHISGFWNGYILGANNADPGYCTLARHITFYTACGAFQDACSDADILKDSTWHMITGVYKASLQRNYFYVDAVLQVDTGGSSSTLSNSANLSFGFLDNTNSLFFNGVLDEGRLYKRVLTQAEILQLYNQANPITVGIHDLNEPALNVLLSPNPTQGLFHISVLNTTGATSLEVYNALGQLVFSQKISTGNGSFDLQDFASGIYYVKARNADKQQIIKLVKE